MTKYKYACELKKGDKVIRGKGSVTVEKVENNFIDNFCFIHTDTGKVIKAAQDRSYEIVE